MNLKFALLCVFLPTLALAQSDFSLSSGPSLTALDDVILPLPPPLADVAVREQIDLARPSAPKPADILKQVVNDLKTHQYAEALPKLEFLQSLRPSEPDILILRGCIYAESGHPEVAEGIFRKAIQIAPTHPWARLNLAEALVTEKKYAEAEDTLTILSSTRPESEVVRFKLITVLAMEKKFPAAEQELQLLRENAATPAYYFASAAIAFAKNDPRKAQDSVKQGQKLYSDAQTTYFSNILTGMGWLPSPP